MSRGKATLYELQAFYGVEDGYNLLELVNVDNYNRALVNHGNNRH